MYVAEYMTRDVITVTPDTPLPEAEKIMRERKIRRLPVVNKRGKLVGLVTRDKLREATPSPVTSLNIHELTYLLSKVKVQDVMEKKVITITPETPVEEAAALGQEKRIGTFPVVKDDKLVGIITATDLFRIWTNAFGFGQPGTRLHLVNCPAGEPVQEVLDIFRQHKAKIRSLFTVTVPATKRQDTIIHLEARESSAVVTGIVEELRQKGCVLEVRKH